MSQNVDLRPTRPDGDPPRSTDSHALELWKHFAASARVDKNTMISTVSWLLAAAAGVVVFLASDEAAPGAFLASDTAKAVAAFAGLLISLIAGFVTFVYAGYASRNWAMADRIASRHQWSELLPQAMRHLWADEESGSAGILTRVALVLSRPTEPPDLAPVFIVYAALSALAILANGAFLVGFGIILVR